MTYVPVQIVGISIVRMMGSHLLTNVKSIFNMIQLFLNQFQLTSSHLKSPSFQIFSWNRPSRLLNGSSHARVSSSPYLRQCQISKTLQRNILPIKSESMIEKIKMPSLLPIILVLGSKLSNRSSKVCCQCIKK